MEISPGYGLVANGALKLYSSTDTATRQLVMQVDSKVYVSQIDSFSGVPLQVSSSSNIVITAADDIKLVSGDLTEVTAATGFSVTVAAASAGDVSLKSEGGDGQLSGTTSTVVNTRDNTGASGPVSIYSGYVTPCAALQCDCDALLNRALLALLCCRSSSGGSVGNVLLSTGVGTGATAGTIGITVGRTDTGNGGSVSLTAGESTAAGAVGGYIVLSSGTGVSSGGAVSITSGSGSADSGAVTVRSGPASVGGLTGTMILSSGNAAAGNSGHLWISSGTAAGSLLNGFSGKVQLFTGSSSQSSVRIGVGAAAVSR